MNMNMNVMKELLQYNIYNICYVQACDLSNFKLFSINPILSTSNNNWSLQGESTKWVSTSAARFKKMIQYEENLQVEVEVVKGEVVDINFISSNGNSIQVKCPAALITDPSSTSTNHETGTMNIFISSDGTCK